MANPRRFPWNFSWVYIYIASICTDLHIFQQNPSFLSYGRAWFLLIFHKFPFWWPNKNSPLISSGNVYIVNPLPFADETFQTLRSCEKKYVFKKKHVQPSTCVCVCGSSLEMKVWLPIPTYTCEVWQFSTRVNTSTMVNGAAPKKIWVFLRSH